MFIKTECGIVKTKDLITVQKPFESHTWGWIIILKYNGKKEDIQLPAKDEEEAKKCYEELSKAIIDMQTPFSSSITMGK